MEVTECPAETKEQPSNIKIDVLEALAKYNLKKKQEQEIDMKGKKKPGQTKPSEASVVKRKSDLQPNTTKEVSIGITEYVKEGDGFSAILKQRYSDFHVYEISQDGEEVHLTNLDPPEFKEEDIAVILPEELAVLLTEEQWKSVDAMMKSADKTTVDIDVTDLDKEKRQRIHLALRQKFQNISSNTKQQVNGKHIMSIFQHNGKERRDYNKMKVPILEFVLYKENMSTNDAISSIARRVRQVLMHIACFLLISFCFSSQV